MKKRERWTVQILTYIMKHGWQLKLTGRQVTISSSTKWHKKPRMDSFTDKFFLDLKWKSWRCFPLRFCLFLKLLYAIFLSNLYFFTKWYPFKNYEKCFLFHLKSSFRFWDIQFFVIFFPSFPHFPDSKGQMEVR